MRRLFISSAGPDGEITDDLVEWLSGRGYQTRRVPASTAATSDEIDQRIGECEGFIAVLSEAWLNSEACQRQVRTARALHKPILLVRVEHVRQALPAEWADWRVVYFGSGDQHRRQLSAELDGMRPPTESVRAPERGVHDLHPTEPAQSWGLAPDLGTAEPEPGVDVGSAEDDSAVAGSAGVELAGTVFAPALVAPDTQFLVQMFAHRPEDRDLVAAQAGEFDSDSNRLGTVMFQSPILAGQRLAFQLLMPGLVIDEPVQTMVWVQSPQSVQFGVTVPAEIGARTVIGTIIVSRESVPVGQLKFKVSVRNSVSAAVAPPPAVTEGMHHYRRAFISYCSADRVEVLKRTQMLPEFGIEFFQDILTLEPGDRWERKIYREIDRCDLFLLFWSTSAKASEWVAKEWRYALNRQGSNSMSQPQILPVIIEGPPPAPPPQELKSLHFNDPIMYFIKASAPTG